MNERESVSHRVDRWMNGNGWIIGGGVSSSSSAALSVTLGFSMFVGDGDDLMYVCVHVWVLCGSVCDSVSVVALDTHHHGHHHRRLFSRRLNHSFNVIHST